MKIGEVCLLTNDVPGLASFYRQNHGWEDSSLNIILEQAQKLYVLEACTFAPVSGHEGGRNRIVTVSRNGEKQYVLHISALGDRSDEEYLAETEFVRFLAENGAPVADVIPSVHGRLVETIETDGKTIYDGSEQT